MEPVNLAQRAAEVVPPWMIPAIWPAGAVLFVFVQFSHIFRFRSQLQTARDAPPWLQRLVDHHAAALSVRSPLTRVVPSLRMPCVWALTRAQLLWPLELLEGLSDGQRRSVIVHELAHLRRRDHWTAWLLLAVGCACWWNPLYWIVRRQLQTSAELACDAWVVATLPAERRVYAEALLQVTEMVSRTRVPVPALGMNGARRIFERRLTMIMRDCVPCRLSRTALAAVVLLAFVAMPGWSQGDDEPQKEEKAITFTVQETPAPDQAPALALVKPFVVFVDDHQDPVTAGDDREKRLQALEQQIQGLLKEVRSLRGNTPNRANAVYTYQAIPTPKPPTATYSVQTVPSVPPLPAVAPLPVQPPPPDAVTIVPAPPQAAVAPTGPRAVYSVNDLVQPFRESADNVIIATRYKLPRAKAEKLAAFLRENVRGVAHAKADEDGLTVTGTQSATNAIHGIVKLMENKSK
jgi:beta-lactamase regulating signal transducer with metallopeptidase domain